MNRGGREPIASPDDLDSKDEVKDHSKPDTIIEIPKQDTDDIARRLLIKGSALVVITLCTCGTNLLIQYSKSSQTETGSAQYSYNPTTVILFSEIIKLMLSFFLAWRGGDIVDIPAFLQAHIFTPDLPKFSVPALLYMIQNNLQFHTMIFVNATAYLIFNQLKILATGVVFRIVFTKQLTWLQWISLVQLTIGTLVSQLSNKESETFSISMYGFALSMTMVMLSASSGVSNEFLIKKVGRGEAESIHIQNMKLYLFGTVANALFLFKSGSLADVFKGFNTLTFLILCTSSINGLAVSVAVKYADTLVKTFATSIAMVSTSVMSIFLFDAQITLTLPIGILIIFCALFSYNYESSFLLSPTIKK